MSGIHMKQCSCRSEIHGRSGPGAWFQCILMYGNGFCVLLPLTTSWICKWISSVSWTLQYLSTSTFHLSSKTDSWSSIGSLLTLRNGWAWPSTLPGALCSMHTSKKFKVASFIEVVGVYQPFDTVGNSQNESTRVPNARRKCYITRNLRRNKTHLLDVASSLEKDTLTDL